jgi:hypothetical protein
VAGERERERRRRGEGEERERRGREERINYFIDVPLAKQIISNLQSIKSETPLPSILHSFVYFFYFLLT